MGSSPLAGKAIVRRTGIEARSCQATRRKQRFMMKKSLNKLTLSKETLRNLNEDQIGDVVGGADKSLQYSRCINNSCGIACTLNC
jgi:hypothetical protein